MKAKRARLTLYGREHDELPFVALKKKKFWRYFVKSY